MQEARNDHATAEKRVALLSGQLEETKAQLEATERAYKASHLELAEVHERVNEMTTANAALQAAKRKLDNDLQSLHVSVIVMIPLTQSSEHCSLNVMAVNYM